VVLGQITCRALLIHTDPATGGIVSLEAADALRRMLPQLEIAYIPGASHSIRRSNVERFIEVVETFLAA
jgi:pimeloyl-ACP methyl ester carboxylesterase